MHQYTISLSCFRIVCQTAVIHYVHISKYIRMDDCYFSKPGARVAALIFSKPFVAVFYEFYNEVIVWLLVCLFFVSMPFASLLGT